MMPATLDADIAEVSGEIDRASRDRSNAKEGKDKRRPSEPRCHRTRS